MPSALFERSAFFCITLSWIFVKLVESHVHLLKIQRTSVASASGCNTIRVVAVRFLKIS